MNKYDIKKILLILFFVFFNSSMSVFSIRLDDDDDRSKVAIAMKGKKWGDNCIVRKGEELYRINAMLASRDDRDVEYVTTLSIGSDPSAFLSKDLIIQSLRVEDQEFVNNLAHKKIAANEVYWNVRRSNRQTTVPHATYLIQYIGTLSDLNIIKL